MVWHFLVKNNLIPYIVIGVLGFFVYTQHNSLIAKDIALAAANASAELANENMGFIVGYTESRFEKLAALKKDEWRKGKHEKTITYTIK